MTREEAIKWLKGIQGCYKKKWFDLNLLNELCVEAIDLAIESLSADEVRVVAEWQNKIVRCKDCIHWNEEDKQESMSGRWCSICRYFSEHNEIYTGENAYCSYGERR